VLREARIEAAAITAQARTDAEQIIASAKLHARSRYLPPRRSQTWPATQPAPVSADGDGPPSIMVLNDRWRIFAPLNADASAMATLYKAYERADPATT
ncbi:hypothetical protein, partial [Nonomuraea sp. LPB2021202275-12-8]|uniref:hypothetical protein n=1 Tax=Nonomuraea sp. LPB2021202275-12-8 TaxID=3120159 RepID=UPI00300C2537